MRLAVCLTARDEEDVIERSVRWHLSQGVDLILIEEALSRDSTARILDSLAEEDPRVIVSHTFNCHDRQAQVMTLLQQRALVCGADWVINADADEFWSTNEGTLHSVLEAVETSFGFVTAAVDEFGFDMSVIPGHRGWHGRRLLPKVAHRPSFGVTVRFGNTDVDGAGSGRAAPLTVLHWPLRTASQARGKAFNLGSQPVSGHEECRASYELLLTNPGPILRQTGVQDSRLADALSRSAPCSL